MRMLCGTILVAATATSAYAGASDCVDMRIGTARANGSNVL